MDACLIVHDYVIVGLLIKEVLQGVVVEADLLELV